MIVFFSLIFFACCYSETDCYNNSDRSKWESSESFDFENDSVIMNDNSRISYISQRFRKKWMLDFCGEISNSYISFSEQPDSQLVPSKGVNLQFLKNDQRGNYKIKLTNDGSIVSSVDLPPRKTESICFAIISGRGYLGVFLKPHQEGKPPVMLHEFSLPRNIHFSYVSKKNSKLSKLCIGNFFGEHHQEVRFDDHWENPVKEL